MADCSSKMLFLIFLAILGLTSAIEDVPERVHWVPAVGGNIPNNAIHAQSAATFCEVEVASKKIPGVTNGNKCQIEVDGDVQTSETFNSLVKDAGTHTGWRYSTSGPPAGAVKCHEGSECYLGFSVYLEGLCEELPGKIFPSQKKMIMTTDKNVFTCPSMLYLYVKPLPKTG